MVWSETTENGEPEKNRILVVTVHIVTWSLDWLQDKKRFCESHQNSPDFGDTIESPEVASSSPMNGGLAAGLVILMSIKLGQVLAQWLHKQIDKYRGI